MPGTTAEGFQFPVAGDVMEPLNAWFALLASSGDTAVANLRTQLAQDPLPAPLTIKGADTQAVTATAWTDLPNAGPITLTLARACWVNIVHGAWLTSTVGDIRFSSRVTGATTLGESQVEVGGDASAWGQVGYTSGTAGITQASGTRFVRLNAGTNTIQLRAYLAGGTTGTRRANYSTLQVAPIRWA